MTTRRRIGRDAGVLNILLTAACAVVLAVSFVLGRGQSTGEAGPADSSTFYVLWLYILLTPIAAVLALMLGDRKTKLIQANYALLALWVAFVGWTGSMTF